MSDILAELDDAMRQERIVKFWKENGKSVLVGIFLAIAATAVISAWRAWDNSVKRHDTDRLIALLEDSNFPDNVKEAPLEMRPSLRGMALVDAAGVLLAQKDKDGALALYTKAADDKSIPPDIRGMAVLMQAKLSPEAGADEKLVKSLGKIAYEKRNPWRYHALLEIAGLEAGRGNFKTAREHLAVLNDAEDLPETLYRKAKALDHVYALKENKNSTKTGS